MAKLYFSDEECRRAGFSAPMINTLRKLAEFVETQTALEETQTELEAQGDAIDDANTDITAANAAINALDARIDAYDLLAPFVRQNQAARPAHTPFAGVTASNPPTQAEVQSISDALVSQSTTIASLLTATDTVNLLT